MINLDVDKYLKEKGVNPLTGEACGMALRMLVDLTPEGVALVNSFLGQHITPGNGWNHRDKEGASMMLTWKTIRDLAIFAATSEYRATMTITSPSGQFSIEVLDEPDETIKDFTRFLDSEGARQMGYRYHVYTLSGDARDGTRNRHYFSGRVE